MSFQPPTTGCFNIPEPSLDEPEPWPVSPPWPPDEEEYDRGEDELNGRFNRS